MKRKLELALILVVSVAVCSAASHLAVRWLRIKANWGGYKHFGPKDAKSFAVLHSSSPGYDAVDWGQISEVVGGPIESWATPGSSPPEWERMCDRSPPVALTFVGVSPYDLNEYSLCDFRADIVPLGQTVRDLRQSSADWTFSKRTLRQYPVMFIRKLFPTVGRSDGVMVGIRAMLQKLVGKNIDAGDAPKFASAGKSDITEKLSDWTEARLQRRITLQSASCMGKHAFGGVKKLALIRLLQRAQTHGRVVLVVVPQSPAYRQAFLTPSVMQEFEKELADLRRQFPQLQIARLDQLPALNHDDCYYDLVHLNMYGQEIATETFLGRLKELALRQ